MALRLSICLNTTAQFWPDLQMAYDLRKAEQEHGVQILQTVHPLVA